LSGRINYQANARSVRVGSPMIHAATMQFGAAQGAFGRTSRGGPIPWGNIPARPFLGLSQTDRAGVLEIIAEYLAGAATP
jgi:phage gpG-like protein